jgi:hypothetical protein
VHVVSRVGAGLKTPLGDNNAVVVDLNGRDCFHGG